MTVQKFYLVGGAVRDILLGREPHDRDYIAVGYTASELLEMGFTQVGKDFPVFLHPETGEEYALPRREKSTGKGHTDFVVETDGVTLEEDLGRRDLTINAMAMDIETGEIIDPYGGRKDLKEGILRHVGPAFKDDPLRVLRVARFNARFPNFEVAPETIELLKSMRKDLRALTPERVFMELKKALSEDAPEMFFKRLAEWDVLEIVFPELVGIKITPLDMWDKNPLARFAWIFAQASTISNPRIPKEWLCVTNSLRKLLKGEDIIAVIMSREFPRTEEGIEALAIASKDDLLPQKVKLVRSVSAKPYLARHPSASSEEIKHYLWNARHKALGIDNYDFWK